MSQFSTMPSYSGPSGGKSKKSPGLRGHGKFSLYASEKQMGKAARIRGGLPPGSPFYTTMSQIVHGSDTTGKFSKTPNPYRDPHAKFDKKAQREIEKAERAEWAEKTERKIKKENEEAEKRNEEHLREMERLCPSRF